MKIKARVFHGRGLVKMFGGKALTPNKELELTIHDSGRMILSKGNLMLAGSSKEKQARVAKAFAHASKATGTFEVKRAK